VCRPQFSLYADCSKGNPSFLLTPAVPAQAETIYNRFVEELRVSASP
jgi:D-Tyr-tRNAtyr deacylase